MLDAFLVPGGQNVVGWAYDLDSLDADAAADFSEPVRVRASFEGSGEAPYEILSTRVTAQAPAGTLCLTYKGVAGADAEARGKP